MATPLTKDDPVDLFRRLGAPSPSDWAHSQVTEGVPQLARFIFLKQAWLQRCAGQAIQYGSRMRLDRPRPDRTTHMPGWAQHWRGPRPPAHHPTTSQRLPAVPKRSCFLRLHICSKDRRRTSILTRGVSWACLTDEQGHPTKCRGHSGTPMNRCWNSIQLRARWTKVIRLRLIVSFTKGRPMHQLVIQFPLSTEYPSSADFAALISLEEKLERFGEDTLDVDGHDAGAGEMNIFIMTDDAVKTFGAR